MKTAAPLVARLRALPRARREAIYGQLTAFEKATLRYEWTRFWARPDVRLPGAAIGRGQLPPSGDWSWWAIIGGRGSGKTRPAAEFVTGEMMRMGQGAIALLLGQSIELARRDMIEGPSGLDTLTPPWGGFDFMPSKNLCTWRSGAKAYLFGADNVDAARGPNACLFWADDLAAFGPNGFKVFQILSLAHRLDGPDGTPCRGVLSTTPIDSEILRHVLEAREGKRRAKYVFSEASTDDNAANLTAKFLTETMAEIAGTDLEEQERYGRLSENTTRVFREVDFTRVPVRVETVADRFDVVSISIDPADSSNTHSCEVGIVAAGLASSAGQAFLCEDASGKFNSDEWPERAWELVERWAPRAASWRFVIEVNRGTKDSSLLRNAEVIRRLRRGEQGFSICEIRPVTSREDKGARAAPLPLLYRAGQIKHPRGVEICEGQLKKLTNAPRQQTRLDRADAAVYAFLDLFGLLEGQRPVALGSAPVLSVGAFGPPAQGAVAVGPEVGASVGLTMAPPGRVMVGAFGGRRAGGW